MKLISQSIEKRKSVYKKIKQYKKLERELMGIFEPDFDGCYINEIRITDFKNGKEQDLKTYCDQTLDYCGDSGWGTMYYYVEDNKYIAIDYSF